MLKVVVIGSGNVAQHLVRVFKNSAQVQLVQVFARNPQKLSHLLPHDKLTGSPSAILEADIYIIAVTDDAIAEVSCLLPFEGRLVVHTSGTVAMQQADSKNRRGVFYPLQTFSKERDIDFKAVPLCLESEYENDYALLEQLAKTVSNHVFSIDSAQRQALHVAAVFVSNFTNHLYAVGEQICEDNKISFSILKPLILETAAKVQELSPRQAQTGPAVRNDAKTISKHLEFLKDPAQKELYTLLTQSIQQDVQKL